MTKNFTVLNTNILSYSCVMIWSKVIRNIPLLDNEFAKGLFDNPTQTNVQISTQGTFVRNIPRLSPIQNEHGVLSMSLPVGVFPRMEFGTQ